MLDIAGIAIEKQNVNGNEAILETLSPVVIYSTLTRVTEVDIHTLPTGRKGLKRLRQKISGKSMKQ